MIKAKDEGQEIRPSGEVSVAGKALRALVGAIYHDKVRINLCYCSHYNTKMFLILYTLYLKGAFAAKNFIYKYILPAEKTDI